MRSGRGRIASVGIGLMVVVGFGAPVIASSYPVLCRINGAIHVPAVVELIRQIPLVSWWIEQSPPFNRPIVDAKTITDGSDWVIWPIVPYGPTQTTDTSFERPSRSHWLGTDEVGRDVLSRMIWGTSVSIKVGVVSMGIASMIGMVLGGLAGFCEGWVDAVVSRIIEVVICFPVFFLILSVLVWLGPDIINVMVVIGLTRWTSIARYTRAEFIRLKQQDFVTAARAVGLGPGRIMVRHLLPNSLAPILVTVSFGVAQAILIEAGLSWLGFGVQPPAPSWGSLLRSAFDNLSMAPHLAYPPCIAVFAAVLLFNLAGDALRDAIDPRLQTKR